MYAIDLFVKKAQSASKTLVLPEGHDVAHAPMIGQGSNLPAAARGPGERRNR